MKEQTTILACVEEQLLRLRTRRSRKSQRTSLAIIFAYKSRVFLSLAYNATRSDGAPPILYVTQKCLRVYSDVVSLSSSSSLIVAATTQKEQEHLSSKSKCVRFPKNPKTSVVSRSEISVVIPIIPIEDILVKRFCFTACCCLAFVKNGFDNSLRVL